MRRVHIKIDEFILKNVIKGVGEDFEIIPYNENAELMWIEYLAFLSLSTII